MHVTFVPLTSNGRLSAKQIIGNRQKLVQWQDAYWRHMVQRYPELERGENAAQSGRKHLPPALYKEAAHLNRQAGFTQVLANDMNPFNTKKTREAIAGILKTFIPQSEHYQTVMKQYDKELKTAEAENIQLSAELKQAKEAKFEERMEVAQLQANREQRHARAGEVLPAEKSSHRVNFSCSHYTSFKGGKWTGRRRNKTMYRSPYPQYGTQAIAPAWWPDIQTYF